MKTIHISPELAADHARCRVELVFGLFYAAVIAFFAWAVFQGYVFGGAPS